MNTNLPRIITALMRLQAEEGLPDGRFADKLGVSRPLWVMTKSGQMPVGIKLLKGAVQVYPNLKPLALDYLETKEIAAVG